MNVILICIDTLRPDHIGAYGNKWIKTPNIDKLAKEGAVFTRAACEVLPTIPVRRSLHTGMRTFPFRKSYYDQVRHFQLRDLKVDVKKMPGGQIQLPRHVPRGGDFLGVRGSWMAGWEPVPLDQVTLAELLRVYGYDTCFITNTGPYMMYPMNFQRGFRHYDFVRGHEGDQYGSPTLGKKLLDVEHYVPVKIRGGWEHGILERITSISAKWQDEEDFWCAQTWIKAAQWLEDNRYATQPFFMLVDCFDPHEPFLVPKKFADIYDTPGYKGVEPVSPHYGPINYVNERELRRMRALYAADVTFMDKWLGHFMAKVRSLGLLDNTLIVFTSDHGFQLGEHGITGKVPAAMWRDLHDVPLVIRHPQGVGKGKRYDALVQNQDIYPTVLSFLGLPPPYKLDGKDLWPVIRGEKHKVRDYLTCGFSLNVRVRDDRYSYIALTTGDEPQLCDLKDDPEEQDNIAKDKPKILKRMHDLVMADAGGQPILPDWEKNYDTPQARFIFWSPFENPPPKGVPYSKDGKGP